MPRLSHGDFFETDPEIEQTFRRRKREQNSKNMAARGNNQPPPGNQPPPNEPPPLVFPPPNQPQPLIMNHPFQPLPNQPPPNQPPPNDQPPFNQPPPYNLQNTIHIADSKDRGIMDYAIPAFDKLKSGIARPNFAQIHFEPKPVMFHMLQTNGQFSGLPSEDPHSHLRSFMEITNSFAIPGVSDDALRLTLFPFSLRDRARDWLNSLEPESVVTWNNLAEKFLKKYFPPNRNAKSRNEICLFRQLDDEAVPEAWDRYKELLRKCPYHGIPYCIQLETFYNV